MSSPGPKSCPLPAQGTLRTPETGARCRASPAMAREIVNYPLTITYSMGQKRGSTSRSQALGARKSGEARGKIDWWFGARVLERTVAKCSEMPVFPASADNLPKNLKNLVAFVVTLGHDVHVPRWWPQSM
jgi:hypothetical protein